MKNTYYFSHDYNSRSDNKIKRMMIKWGYQGYGVFWALVEDLYQNANALPTDYDFIANDLRVDTKMIQSIINDFGLFIVENETFSSLSVQRRLEEMIEKSAKARQSAFARWNKDNANALPTQSDSNAINKEIKKEKKEKNNKEINSETFFSYFLKEGAEKVKQKAERFDLRDQDINFFANECIVWCKKKSIEPKNWVAWEAFFDKWINDGIYLYKKKRTKTMRARDEEKAAQPKKPKYESVEDYYLKEEGVTIIS